MKWLASRLFWGLLLIVGGILLLVRNLGIFDFAFPFWSIILTIAGLAFLSVFISDRNSWWTLIPGLVLLSLALISFLEFYFPAFESLLGGTILFGGIGLSFVLIYFVDKENWWAIIPAGVLFTLATIVGLGNILLWADIGGFFFIGLGLTFLVVAILPSHRGQLKWALIPGFILLAFGLLILAALGEWINIIGPFILIVIGVFLIYRSFRKRADR
jgi:hypothetical protein